MHAAAAIVLVASIDPRPGFEDPPPGLIRVTLAPAPAPPPPEPSLEPLFDPVDPPAPGPAESAGSARYSARAQPEAMTADPTEERIELETPTAPATIDLARLRAQLPDLMPATGHDDEPAPPGARSPTTTRPWAETGSAIRGLPLGGGWLNPYVGPVQPRSETWGAPNGEQRGYFVLANGQAVCTRVDAPTNDEMMNPWMSMRVTYMRLCGRVRGTAPPAGNLDYAPAPAALRRVQEIDTESDASIGDVVP